MGAGGAQAGGCGVGCEGREWKRGDIMSFEVGLSHYLVLSGLLFSVGVLGMFLNRRNVIILLLCVELILLSVNINFVAFSAAMGDLTGQVFALFVLAVAAAESAVGLAILVVYFRNRRSIEIDDVNMMRG